MTTLQHHAAPATGLPLFTWAPAQDRRQHHPGPLHIERLRLRYGLTAGRAVLIAHLAGIGPQEAR